MTRSIKKDTLISSIVDKHPQAVELLSEYGLSCATCFMGQFETLEQGAKLHGFTDAEIKKMLREINQKLKKGQ